MSGDNDDGPVGRVYVVSFVAFARPVVRDGAEGYELETPSGKRLFVQKYDFEDVSREITGSELETARKGRRRKSGNDEPYSR